MKPDVEVFFTDPGILLRKCQKQVLQVGVTTDSYRA
jgi:hypothetical protein